LASTPLSFGDTAPPGSFELGKSVPSASVEPADAAVALGSFHHAD
jgi:hypothetical protein